MATNCGTPQVTGKSFTKAFSHTFHIMSATCRICLESTFCCSDSGLGCFLFTWIVTVPSLLAVFLLLTTAVRTANYKLSVVWCQQSQPPGILVGVSQVCDLPDTE